MIQNIINILKYLFFNIYHFLFSDKNDLVKLPVLHGSAKGLIFSFDLINRKESAYLFGKYDKDILNILDLIDMTGWVVWDCGTYLGFYTNYFAKKVGNLGCVVAIEPDINNIKRTENNLNNNKFNNYILINVAIGIPIGLTDFIISSNTNSHLPNYYSGGTKEEYTSITEKVDSIVKIQSVSFDQILHIDNAKIPDFIKIDIEGAELDALNYMDMLLKTIRPLILLELHNPECDKMAWKIFNKQNYKIIKVPEVKTLIKLEDVYGTILCVPNEKIDLISDLL